MTLLTLRKMNTGSGSLECSGSSVYIKQAIACCIKVRETVIMFASRFVVLAVMLFSVGSAAKLPETFELCKIDATDSQTCLKRAFQKSFVLLKDGLPELGVLPIDPLEISELTVSQGEGAVSMTLTMTNVVATGFKDVQVISSAQEEIKPGSTNMVSEVLVPDLKLLADYEIEGRILVLPIKGQGRCNFTLSNVHVKAKLENEIITVDGENYIRVNKFIVDTNPEEILMHLEGLFGGDVRL
ncbi:hypothetical protein B566_EDAN015251, partial [Ephemera danica]